MRKTPVLLINLFSLACCAADFQYFNGKDIDYWNEGKRVNNNTSTYFNNKSSKNSDFSGSNTIRGKDALPFQWSNYKDPQKPEFWDDGGDWIPPRPFREAAANPTKENIDAYLNWMKAKTEVVTRFQTALTQRVAETEQTQSNNGESNFDWKKSKIIYVYQTSCAHCRASSEVIEAAKKLGAHVVFVQLDYAKNPPLHAGSVSPKNIPTALSRDTKSLLSQVQATPTWIFEGKSTSTEFTGSLTFSELLNTAKQFFSGDEI